jgi:hypothetical protein
MLMKAFTFLFIQQLRLHSDGIPRQPVRARI